MAVRSYLTAAPGSRTRSGHHAAKNNTMVLNEKR